MKWISEANKLGRYQTTYYGFRIYWIKEPSTTERIEIRKDGKWRVTDFHKGELVAIDKTGYKITDTSLEGIAFRIEWLNLDRRYKAKYYKLNK